MTLAAIEQERDRALKDRNVSERSLTVIEEENENLRRANERLRAELDALKDTGGEESGDLRRQLDELRGELADAEKKLQARHQHIARLAPELDAVTRDRDELRQLLVEREAQIAGLERQVKEAGSEGRRVKELEEELADARAEAETSRAALDGAQKDLKSLETRLQQARKQSGKHEELLRQVEAREREAEVAKQQVQDLRNENEHLQARNVEIAGKRDDVVQGLESAVEEIDALKEALAGQEIDNRTLREDLKASQAEAEKLRREVEGTKALQAELAELERRHAEAQEELVRVGGSLTNVEQAAEKWRDEIDELKQKIETTTEKRHDAEKQLVETRARLESVESVRDEYRGRIKTLEDDLRREREQVDKSSPAEALTSLSSQLQSEREKWEKQVESRDAELGTLRERLNDAEARESELSAQLESVQLSNKDVNRAKALAGQRRAQIERMQSDVEAARRQAKETEQYWKDEMKGFQSAVAEQLEAAENAEPGSDKKLQKLLEDLKVGVSDKYAKLRRRHTRMKKDLDETKDHLAAVERILAKREEEEQRLRKIVEELEERENVKPRKKPAAKKSAQRKPAKKKPATKKPAKKKPAKKKSGQKKSSRAKK